MAVVQGIKEKVHLPIYDSVRVKPGGQLRDTEASSTLKFFVNVQGKTKLETNLQAASLLPHYNTFEARAMRVVISDLPPEYPGDVEVEVEGTAPRAGGAAPKLKTNLKRLMELLGEARESETGEVTVNITGGVETAGGMATKFSIDDLEEALGALDQKNRKAPPKEQIRPNNGSGTIIGKLIYTTVTTLYVGEKIMIQMPTWFFPAGAGPYSESGGITTHGEPSPTATFRFAEPIFIDKQQNFRVEMEVPDSDVLKELHKLYGPLFMWVVLDGYMVRDVQ
jgi:hypothetical protein